ncbi:MAG TPA: cytochrome P450, partial [Myxococcales bacterium]|nr:cytochrome P450 [Myxococcales bacterium]
DVVCFVGPEAFKLFLDERYFTRAHASPPHIEQILHPNAVPFLEDRAFKRRKELLMEIFKESALDGYARILEQVMVRYQRGWAERGTFAWVPELTAMAMSVAGSLFIGADPAKDDKTIADAFQTAFGGMLTLPIKLPFTPYGKALKAHQSKPMDDAMAQALAARSKDGEKLSDEEICIETFHFFGAYVPVIGGLAFLMMCLGQNRDVLDKLRAEVREKLPSGTVTLARLRDLPYLERVCKESRRVQPVLPITFFAKVKEECSFDGVRVPKGMKAVGCISPTLQDSAVYEAPAKFEPDRWINAGPPQQSAWVPHGGGQHLTAHRCAGEQLANLMLKTFAVLMLRDYDWTFPRQDFSPTKGQLFATPKGGLQVKLNKL